MRNCIGQGRILESCFFASNSLYRSIFFLLHCIFGRSYWYHQLFTKFDLFLNFWNEIILLFCIINLSRILAKIIILLFFFNFFMLVGKIRINVNGCIGIKMNVGACGGIKELLLMITHILKIMQTSLF